MFELALDRRRRLLTAIFSGHVLAENVPRFEAAVTTAFATEGPMHALYDFTDVETVALPDRAIVAAGRRPQLCPGYERVVVVPQAELFELSRVYGACQAQAGVAPPTVVRSRREADAYLRIALSRRSR